VKADSLLYGISTWCAHVERVLYTLCTRDVNAVYTCCARVVHMLYACLTRVGGALTVDGSLATCGYRDTKPCTIGVDGGVDGGVASGVDRSDPKDLLPLVGQQLFQVVSTSGGNLRLQNSQAHVSTKRSAGAQTAVGGKL
jgi:hypothetical protein